MEEPTTKSQILTAIQAERLALETLLAKIPPAQMTLPDLHEGWSVKDILAHITAWEELMQGWVQISLRGETPDRPAPGESWETSPTGPSCDCSRGICGCACGWHPAPRWPSFSPASSPGPVIRSR